MKVEADNVTTPLDRLDIAGWLLLVLGGVVISATVLAPANLELRRMSAQRQMLERQVEALSAKRDNYRAMIEAIDHNQERIIQRLAWRELNLKPVGAEVAEGVALASSGRGVAMDGWVEPSIELLPASTLDVEYPDSMLTRLVLGPASPWVMGLGAWLMLLGVVLAPMRSARGGSSGVTDADGDAGDGER